MAISTLKLESNQVSRVIRFGIGDRKQGPFAVWRLWVQGNEVYLADRSTIQQVKASLHSSGKWSFRMRNKKGFTIDRPSPFRRGLTRGPGVLYFGGLIEQPLPSKPHPDDADIVWFNLPPFGVKRSFTVFFADESLSRTDITQMLKPSPQLLGPLELRSREQVWLAALAELANPDEVRVVRKMKDDISINFRGDESAFSRVHAVMVHTTSEEEMVFVGLLLVRENFSGDS